MKAEPVDKDARIARTTAAGRRLMLLIRQPRPEARAAGQAAWFTGEMNPHEPESAEAVNWDAGWRDACQQNS